MRWKEGLVRGEGPVDIAACSIAEAARLEGGLDGVVGRPLNPGEVRPRVEHLSGCSMTDAGRLGGGGRESIVSAVPLSSWEEEESAMSSVRPDVFSDSTRE